MVSPWRFSRPIAASTEPTSCRLRKAVASSSSGRAAHRTARARSRHVSTSEVERGKALAYRDIGFKAVKDFLRLAIERRASNRPSPPAKSRSRSMKMFSATVSDVLIVIPGHQRHAASLGLTQRARPERRAVEDETAAVGLLGAGDDLEQRGLAGAVLAHERMDLAGRRLSGTRSSATVLP